MFKSSVYALAIVLAGAGAACARSDQPVYAPEPAWVKPVPIPTDVKPNGAAADVLLFTAQTRLGPDGTQSFVESAIRIDAPEGLQQAGSLAQVWNPLTDTLTIHRARILRGGQVIDLLASGKSFTVLRRETNLEAAMIDGALTATLQPEGLQVGDVLDFAYTLTRREPALAGHSEGDTALGHTGSVGRLVARTSWPAGQAFRVWKTDDLPAVTPVTEGGWTQVALDQTNAVSPEAPKGAPVYDQLFGLLEVNDFKDWRQVSATSWPLYDRAATLQASSPLKAEIARIAAASLDAKARTLAALKLVEGQTRYLFVGLDAGGLTPAAADLTWTRRFGDCKGKTVLLLALLRGLGIQAEPALVNTAGGEALDRLPPSMTAFNHVIIRAEVAGRTYWLDGTRMGDENLDVIPVPNFHWALPVTRDGAALEPIGPQPPLLPYADTILKVNMAAGVDKPASVHAETIMRGDVALAVSLGLKQASPTDGDRALRQMFINQHSWFTPKSVAFTYDPQTMTGRATADGQSVVPFASSAGGSGGVRDWSVDGAAVGYDPDFNRTSDYHRDAPYAVAYPMYVRNLVEVTLPDGGKNFEIDNGEVVDKTAAGVAYNRTAVINEGKLVMSASRRAVAASFPASDAASAEASLRGMASYDTFLRYTAPEPKSAAAPPKPVSTGDLATDAEAAFARRDFTTAEAGFTAALQKQKTAKLYYDRGAARAAQAKFDLAEADMRAALDLNPKDAFASFALGRIALKRGDLAEAARRFSTAQADAESQVQMADLISFAYQAVHRYGDAAPYSDRIAAAAKGADQAGALNNSCWVRALGGIELDRALKDCDAALMLKPGYAPALDSRALVELRLGQTEKALADYDAALNKRPGSASSLFGRSIAEQRLGRTADAARDEASARQIAPKVAEEFASIGVTH